jgi:hypothetical protein
MNVTPVAVVAVNVFTVATHPSLQSRCLLISKQAPANLPVMESEKGELKHLAQKEIWQVHRKVTCARVNQHFIL